MYTVGGLKKKRFELIHTSKDVNGAVTWSLVVPIGPKATKHEHIMVPENSKRVNRKWKKVFQRG